MNNVIDNLATTLLVFKKLNFLMNQEIITDIEVVYIEKGIQQMILLENQLLELFKKLKSVDLYNEGAPYELLSEIHDLFNKYINTLEDIQDNVIKKIIGRYGRYQ